MYDKRIKIFVILTAFLLLICLLRLAQMQLLSHSFYRSRIAELRKNSYRQLQTLRGKILDRKGEAIALNELRFQLCISYKLTRFLDGRVREIEQTEDYEDELENLYETIDKCAQFRMAEPSEIINEIQKINEFIWNQRVFQAWRSNFGDSEVLQDYNDITSVPLSEAIADFEKKEPDPVKRLQLVNKVDIAEMYKSWPLLELSSDDDFLAAQLEFMNANGVEILPCSRRVYPYGSAAAQTIGWVGRPQKSDKELFAKDRLLSYLDDEEEVCGREDGVEYVCEAMLRGRRGEIIYDVDYQPIRRTEVQFGKDVRLTLDIELQKKIEDYLTNCAFNANCKAPTAAVVIEVATGNILALVSTPVFNLNRVRYDYGALVRDPNDPLRNRAINEQYPPGSVVKPLILIAGLESGKIDTDEIISCPAEKAPEGWPSCWYYNKYFQGHDQSWPNNARNAIKGSCNIYFSSLANRIGPALLQRWLFKFGYGHKLSLATRDSSLVRAGHRARDLRQAQGQISSILPKNTISLFEQLPPLEKNERRYFGMGQGNLRTTPLQVTNAMAAIARGGIYQPPRLFLDFGATSNEQRASSIDLNISPQTLDVVRDGMSAVVSEPGGTAYKEFAYSGLAEQAVMVYGKTGSTETPDNAWFAGFAEDSTGCSIAIAVVVEGGQHGSSDAGPLARNIIQFCIDAGYVGQSPAKMYQELGITQ